MKTLYFFILLTLSAVILYFTSFTNHLFQDDFFNIFLSQKQTLFDAFNIFKKPILDFYFYRPLTTQFFWSIGYNIFGLESFGYHFVLFTSFILSCFLVYKLLSQFTSERISKLTTLLYLLAPSHFYRIYFLSQFQEVGLVIFSLLTAIFFVKRSYLAILFFILALTSKETAIVIPAFLLAIGIIYRKGSLKILSITILVSVGYLVSRFFFFGFASGGAYDFDLDAIKIANNYLWYALWSLGVPEHYMNIQIIKGNTVINTELFTLLGTSGNLVLLSLAIFTGFLLLQFHAIKRVFTENKKELWLAASLFLLFLFPVGFFPFHKFAYSLAVPQIGPALILALVISKLSHSKTIIATALFAIVSYYAFSFNSLTHWANNRSWTAKKTLNYFRTHFPNGPKAANIYFRNNDYPFCTLEVDGLHRSSEVANGIGGVHGLRLLYKNDNLPVFFEDSDNNRHLYRDSLMINSKEFVK